MLRSGEKAPPIPADLLDDLIARFGKIAAMPAPAEKVYLFARIQSFVSTPSFGMAAAALAILAVALPTALRDSGGSASTSFRGGSAGAAATASSIVLIGAPVDIVSSLGESGDFEKGSILTADTATGAKVIVDFNSATVTAIDANGQTVHSAGLPADRDELTAAIAEALGKL